MKSTIMLCLVPLFAAVLLAQGPRRRRGERVRRPAGLPAAARAFSAPGRDREHL